MNTGLWSQAPSAWSMKAYILPGVICPLKSAAPPFNASKNNVVKTPWPPIVSKDTSLSLLAVNIEIPSPISALLLLFRGVPNAPEWQQSKITTI